MANGGAQAYTVCFQSSNSGVQVQDASGNITYYAANMSQQTIPATDHFTFWPGSGATPSGTLTQLYIYGNCQVTSLNVQGLTSLTYLNAYGNPISSLNAANLTVLGFACDGGNSAVTSLDVSGDTALTAMNLGGASMPSFTTNLTGCIALNSIEAVGGGFSAGTLNTIFTALPDRTNLSAGNIHCGQGNPGYSTATASIATAKNWTVSYYP
jgi:hypothetical protein